MWTQSVWGSHISMPKLKYETHTSQNEGTSVTAWNNLLLVSTIKVIGKITFHCCLDIVCMQDKIIWQTIDISWQTLWMVQPECVKRRHAGENWFRRTKDTRSMIICKLMINTPENICAGVYWNDISVPGWKLSWWLNDVQCGWRGRLKT